MAWFADDVKEGFCNYLMKLSILTPTYNGERFLRAAIATLQSQDFQDWESIIVDDGSKDATPRIAREIASEDSRIRVICQENGGVSVARNHALNEARGDWILWLDEDDAIIPGALGRIAALIDAHQTCQCFQFPYLAIQPDGSFLKCGSDAYAKFGDREYPGAKAFDILFASNDTAGMNWQPWRFVYRHDALPRFRPGRIHEDIDVLPLHLASLERVFIASDPFYAYRMARADSATTTFTPRRVRDILDVTADIYDDLARSSLPDSVKRGFSSMLAVNLFGFYIATPTFAEPDRTALLNTFAEHSDWLTAIDWPRSTAWLKRLIIRLLGVRGAACLLSRIRTRFPKKQIPGSSHVFSMVL